MPDRSPKTNRRNGRFDSNIDHAERAAKAARLAADGKSYTDIAAELGYADKSGAWRAVQRAKASVMETPALELIQVEAAQLDSLYVEALDILGRDHVAVSQGRVVKDDDGNPILDDGPKLAALRELRSIRESYRKLLGLDAATKTEVSGGVKYEIVGVDMDQLR
ncbi:hypothetical protein ACGF5F_32605 [Streptomyces sp. NPDC047821]|uniref:hypothetical protein n=1 Tax=Streptomyces sp. NPDC047821 TaxID=3365488 RepID=UPI0037132964